MKKMKQEERQIEKGRELSEKNLPNNRNLIKRVYDIITAYFNVKGLTKMENQEPTSEEFYKGIPFFKEIINKIYPDVTCYGAHMGYAVSIPVEKYLIDSSNVKPDGEHYHHQIYFLDEKKELQASNTAIDEDSKRVLSKIEQMLDEDKSITWIRTVAKRKK